MLLLFYSCSSEKNKEVAAHIVPSTDFRNILIIEGYVEPLNSTTLFCPMDVDGVLTYIVEDGTLVKEGEVVSIIEDNNIQTAYDNTLVELENAEANLEKTKADLHLQYTLLEAQVKNNEADTEIANLDSLQLIYSTPTQRRIKEMELQKVAIEKNKFEKKLQSLDIIQKSEIRKRELEIQRLRTNMQRFKDRLDALTIKSPKDGMATRGIYWMTGKKVQPSDPVWNNMPLVILPDLENMKIIINASEREYKSINVNDSVYYTFDAMPGNTAYGKITKKSPVGKPVGEKSKVKIFEIEASIDSFTVLPDPGYTANCNIVLREVLDTIVVPQIAVFDEDSIKVVYVKEKKGYEMRQVTTGLSSSRDVIITAGLGRSEILALSRPGDNLVKSKKLLPKKDIVANDSVPEEIKPDAVDETGEDEDIIYEMPFAE